MIGQTISHYRIVEKLGEGGMGVVYKAQDTTLERTVALKFLAAHLLNDNEAKQRFLREAKAAASLDHPNICTVYEVGEAEGKTFLAMAFLKGQTLEDRIAKGPLPLKDALDIARQVAEGLNAAHAEGVVHRDVKPANILVSPDGRATIMDFGLARLTEASKLTRQDQTVGTAAYMSPEQLQGGEVDHRTDVWALGCSLYEMVAGVRPFKGQYDQALAYEILNEEPEPLTSVRSGVPMQLELLVAKCLAKDPGDRYAHADEIARDLRTLSDKLRSGRSTILKTGLAASQAGRAHWAATERGPRWKRQAPWAVAAALALALAALSWLHFGEPPPREAIAAEFTVTLPGGVRPLMLSLSPDGRHVAVATLVGKKSLWVRSLDSLEAREIPGTEGATYPFWSPDSRFLGFFADGKLKKIALAGGPPINLCDAPSGRGGSWSRDGAILFAPGPRHEIQLVGEGGGEPAAVTSGNEEGTFARRFPEFLPDGQHFLYLDSHGTDETAVYLGSLDGEAPRRLLPHETNVSYVPPFDDGDEGHLLLVRDSALMAQPFDAERLTLTGDPFPVVSRVSIGRNAANYLFSASRTGVLAHSAINAFDRVRQLVWVDRDGRRIDTLSDPGVLHGIALSPNERRAAVAKRDRERGGESDLWLIELNRKTWTRFTTETDGESFPVWSPDGGTIAHAKLDGASEPIQIRSAGGVGSAQPVPGSISNEYTWDWSPDGRWILVGRRGVRVTFDLWALSATGEEEPFEFLATEFEEGQAQFSPDGAWVAYTSNKSGRDEVYLRSFPKAEGEWKVSSDGGRQPRWRGDGNELYYVAEDGTLTAIAIRKGDTIEVGPPKPLFPFTEDAGSPPFFYDVESDGKRFLMLLPVENALDPALTVTTDWLAKARR